MAHATSSKEAWWLPLSKERDQGSSLVTPTRQTLNRQLAPHVRDLMEASYRD